MLRPFASKKRGAVLLLAALLLPFLIALLAFAIDIGYMAVMRTQCQAAADSAALAAAAVASNSSSADTKTTAVEYANKHIAGGSYVNINTSAVVFGTWNSTTRTFTPDPEGAAVSGGSIKVTVTKDAPTFFGRIIGSTGT